MDKIESILESQAKMDRVIVIATLLLGTLIPLVIGGVYGG